jgi:putative FmdB family regulatory protein
MPTYRYRCTECGEEFELWQSIKDDAIRTHDAGCGGEVLKVLTPAGIVLKGSGFYKTDSRSADSKRKSSGDTKSKDTKDRGGDSGGDGGKDGGKDGGGGSSDQKSSSDSGSDRKGGDSSSTTKTGESKSTAGAAKPS